MVGAQWTLVIVFPVLKIGYGSSSHDFCVEVGHPHIHLFKSCFFLTQVICGTLYHLQFFFLHTTYLPLNVGCTGTLDESIEFLSFFSFSLIDFRLVFLASFSLGWTFLKSIQLHISL